MEWLLIGIGVALFGVLGWFLHRRFGGEEAQTHSSPNPSTSHDAKPLVGQGLEGQGIE